MALQFVFIHTILQSAAARSELIIKVVNFSTHTLDSSVLSYVLQNSWLTHISSRLCRRLSGLCCKSRNMQFLCILYIRPGCNLSMASHILHRPLPSLPLSGLSCCIFRLDYPQAGNQIESQFEFNLCNWIIKFTSSYTEIYSTSIIGFDAGKLLPALYNFRFIRIVFAAEKITLT